MLDYCSEEDRGQLINSLGKPQMLLELPWLFSFFLGGGNSNIFYFHPYLGKIPILTNIFQTGWNHQLVLFSTNKLGELFFFVFVFFLIFLSHFFGEFFQKSGILEWSVSAISDQSAKGS